MDIEKNRSSILRLWVRPLSLLYAGFYRAPHFFIFIFLFVMNLVFVSIYVALECASFWLDLFIMFWVQIEIIYDYGREDNNWNLWFPYAPCN